MMQYGTALRFVTCFRTSPTTIVMMTNTPQIEKTVATLRSAIVISARTVEKPPACAISASLPLTEYVIWLMPMEIADAQNAISSIFAQNAR